MAKGTVQCFVQRQKPLRKVQHGSTFCNDFNQLSALLRSHTSPLPSVNACAMFRARKIAQCDSALTRKFIFC